MSAFQAECAGSNPVTYTNFMDITLTFTETADDKGVTRQHVKRALKKAFTGVDIFSVEERKIFNSDYREEVKFGLGKPKHVATTVTYKGHVTL